MIIAGFVIFGLIVLYVVFVSGYVYGHDKGYAKHGKDIEPVIVESKWAPKFLTMHQLQSMVINQSMMSIRVSLLGSAARALIGLKKKKRIAAVTKLILTYTEDYLKYAGDNIQIMTDAVTKENSEDTK